MCGAACTPVVDSGAPRCWVASKAPALMSSHTLSKPQKPARRVARSDGCLMSQIRTVPGWFLQALFGLCIGDPAFGSLHKPTGLKQRATLHGIALRY